MNTVYIMIGIIVVVAVGMEVYKKNLRGDGNGKTRASKKELEAVALAMSVVFVLSLGFGFSFPGFPIAIPGYILGTFLLQWVVSMKMLKVALKWFLRSKGVTEDDFKEGGL